MIEFIGGLVLGAVMGVVADRVWSWFEGRPRFRITTGRYGEVGDKEGISITVQNVGKAAIPPYELALFHPSRGTMSCFPAKASAADPLLPGQERCHHCEMFVGKKPNSFVQSWLKHERDLPVDHVEASDFVFKVILKNSKSVLCESAGMGQALAQIMLNGFEVGPNDGWQSFTSWGHARIDQSSYFQKRTRQKEMQQIIADIETENAKKKELRSEEGEEEGTHG